MVVKSIRAFLLLLAGLAIVVHMIVPHDHHLPGPVNGLKESCALSNEKSDHRHSFPIHCNVFNDLAAEKISPVVVKMVTQTSYASVIWHPDQILQGLNLLLKVKENTGKPFPDIYIPDFSQLRAPPSMS